MDLIHEDDPEGIEDYNNLLTITKSDLPFLKKVIDSSDYLGIKKQHLEKLHSLYFMLDQKKLSISKLRSCQKVVCNLYNKYHNLLKEYDEIDSENCNQLDECENKSKFSKIDSTSNKDDLKLFSKSEISSNVVTSSEILTVCNQLESVDHDLNRMKNSNFEKSSEHINNNKSSTSENLNNDNDPMLPEFSDSRLRLNKLIGFATNASIEKLNTIDESVSNAEIAKQVFNEITKQSKNKVIYQNMLKDINMDAIDVNHMKQVIESIKNIEPVHPVQPPSLPPVNLLDLGRTQYTLSVDSNNDNLLNENEPVLVKPQSQSTVILVPNRSSTIRDKLNNDINKFHKIGTSSEPKQKFISALKPGTLIDLENSKVARSSLLMESIRTVQSNEKSSDIKQFPPPAVARDPRIRNKSLMNPENNNSLGQIHLQTSVHQLIPSVIQNSGSVSNPPHLSANINHILNHGSQQESSHIALSGYNGQTNYPMLSNYTNIQPFGNLSPTEQNDRLNQSTYINCRPTALNQYRSNRNDYTTVDNQHSIPILLHTNTITHNEPIMNNHDPVSPNTYKCRNDLIVNRDPRSMKDRSFDRKLHEPHYRNFKEYREAKYGKEKYTISDHRKNKMDNILEQQRKRNFNLENEKFNPYNHSGIINDSDGIKNFKIPKIKRNEELVNKNLQNDITEEALEIENIEDDNLNRDTHVDTIEANDNKKTEVIKDINVEIIKDDEEKKLKTDENQEIKVKDSTIIIDNEKKDIESKQCNISKESTDESTKAKKPKKCTKEKEFEKIVKEAAANLNDDECGPRIRTRSSLKKMEDTIKKDLPKKSSKSLDLGECSKSIEYVETSIGETGQDVISSTSKEPSEVGTPIEGECKNLEENTVSSNVVNSTVDAKSNQLVPSSIIDLQNPGLLTLIEILQDEQKRLKLQEFLNATDTIKSTKEDEPKTKNMSHEEYSDFDKQKKLRKKMRKKEKRLKEKMNKKVNKTIVVGDSSNDKESNNDNYLIDGNSNKDSMTMDISNDGNSSSGNSYENSIGQGKVKSSKRKKYKENYGNFEIKDKNLSNTTELKDLKIVIAKYDKKNRSSETPVEVHTPSVPTPKETVNLKPKKPFLGPLSVKLARNKLETDQNNSNNVLDGNNQVEIKPNNEIISNGKAKKSFKSKNKKVKTNAAEEPSLLIESQETDPIVEIDTPVKMPLEDEHSITDQNNKEIIPVKPNVGIKTDIKKSRSKMTELDKLHADISEMYDCDAVLNAPSIRHCRQNKQIDYTNNNNTVMSKKNRTSIIDDKINEDNSSEEVSKNPNNKKNKSKLKINKKVCISKKNIVKHNIVNSTLNKKVKGYKKTKKIVKSHDKLELNNLSINYNAETVQVKTTNVLTEDDFKDQSYFQTSDNMLECKFCSYNGSGLNIVRHYKEQHSDKEVLPSRLSINCAEILINESLKEHYGLLDVQDLKPLKDVMPIDTNFTCVFCQAIIYGITTFYDHITSHTGEYRYICKVCPRIYQSESELEKHILEHSNYDKSEGISNLLHSNPVGNNKIFGYLCPFCYYIQLDYHKIVNHLTAQHFDEDKKFNGHWTVIRVNMSIGDDDYTNSIIDYSNLVGCLPPIINDNVISKDINKKYPINETSVSTLVAQKKKAMKDAASLGKHIFNEDKLDSPNLNICHFSPVEVIPSCNEDTTEIDDDPILEHQEYTLKDNFIKCTVADLSCELINSILLYKCSVSKCKNNQFSTVVLIDFLKHINLNHQRIVWDRKCDVCKHTVEKIINKQYLLKDALYHIISYHLVLKEIQQPDMSNFKDMEKGQNSLSIDTVNSKEMESIRVRSPLRVRCDLYSTANNEKRQQMAENMLNRLEFGPQGSENIEDTEIDVNEYADTEDCMVDNSEQPPSSLILVNPFDTSVQQTNIIKISNKTISPICPKSSFLCIEDVRSLRKRGTVCVEKRNQYEIMFPNPNVYLESGQQIVNNGTPINGTYCLVDTIYRKCYLKKTRELPMNVMKTRLAYKDMTTIPKLLGLFKCMDRTCTKIFSDIELFKLHMQLHFSNMERKKKNQLYNTEQFKNCIYCFKKFDDAESLANHISEKYYFCKYFCPFCFYRAYSPCHVLVHQSIIHPNFKPKIIQLDYEENSTNNTKELLKIVDYNAYILPFTCNVGSCTFSCYVPSDFISHLNQDHQQCDKFCCYICANQDNGKGFIALQPKLMIKHFILHNINVYQCIFCLFGSEFIDSMMSHLAMEHFEYEPLCLERTLMSGRSASTLIQNLTIIRIKKSISNGELEIVNIPREIVSLPETQRNKRRRLDCSDVLSAAMKSACIEETTQSSDTIVITVPDRSHLVDNSNSLAPAIDNEFIMLDDNDQNDLRESLRINDIWTENENIVEPLEQPDDIITIDDEDDLPATLSKTVATEISIKRKRSAIEESIDSPNKNKRLALPIIPLDKLFFCKNCDLVFSNGKEYQHHLNNCSNWNSNHSNPCVFCSKSFKTAFNMTEHLKLHGPDRFICNLCNFNAPSRRAIGHHMKVMHNLIDLEFVPVRTNFTNIDNDEFIVYEDKERKTPKKPVGYKCGECVLTSVERKSIVLHMRDVHNIYKYETCLISYPHNKHFLEEYEIKKVDPPIDSLKQIPTKRKRPNNYLNNDSNKTDSTIPTTFVAEVEKVLSFSPNTVDSIPKMHIFSNPIGCSLCTYKTKVRSNLIIHLDGHKKGQDNTTKEIVNPVPSIGKSELMFDKMINLSASSFEAMNSEKMKIDELNMKIVEVPFTNDLDIELFPPFIPKIKRFQCSEGTCNQQFFSDDDLLKTHISIIHKDFQFYLCPHCPPNCIQTKEVKINNIAIHLMYHTENLYKCQYCDYIDFNRDELRKHMRNVHLLLLANENQSNIIIIRQSKLNDYSTEKHIQAQPHVAQWKCNMCSSTLKFTDSEIMSHIIAIHQQSKMFKCPMCPFEHINDTIQVFEEHFKYKHPSVAAKCMKVYDIFTDAEQKSPKKVEIKVTNNQEQQALESIQSLVLPTCRGIPIESIATTSKVNNKSQGVSKSPKSVKKSPLQSRKQKPLIDDFSEDDSLGIISQRGQFTCPRCSFYETRNIESFRDHLYKDVNYKKWKCMKCFEISDSPKKMAWHVKKHGPGTKYEKIESIAKLKWVERVITHQQLLFIEFNKQNREKNAIHVEQKNTIADKNITARKRTVMNNTPVIPQMSNEIIDLLDDSDSE